jgi:SulP family sulfate permease
MEQPLAPALAPAKPSFVELFTPKIVTVLREGYGFSDLKADAIAGLTVAVVALPLSMAIAIASGTTPDRGLYTAIIGGFFISLLGGSRFQIGGPAGAFIVLVAATVQSHGIEGLILATVMAGFFLMAVGYLRLGTYIKFIPYPVTVGFTAGIAVIIFTSQIHDLFGLTITVPEPGELLAKIPVLVASANTVSPSAVLIAGGTLFVILFLKRVRPGWPGFLIAIAAAGAAATFFGMPVETIGSRFGEIPRLPPAPALPAFSWELAAAVLPDAIAFTVLGAIESLLSAVVADGMTGRRHRSNCELVAQGVGNIASGLFGGICATGTIARTATNVRAGARSPIAGMLHSLFLLLFLVVAAPLASYIPLAALAVVLALVAWNMVEKHALAALVRSSVGDAAVVMATFLLTIFRDLTAAIVVGFAISALLFIHRMASAASVEAGMGLASLDDRADDANGERQPYDASVATDPEVVVYRISGAFFFGAASTVGAALDRIADQRKAFVIDFSAVPMLDSTAANTIAGVARKAGRNGVNVYVTGTSRGNREILLRHGVRPPLVRFKRTIALAVESVHRAGHGAANPGAPVEPAA